MKPLTLVFLFSAVITAACSNVPAKQATVAPALAPTQTIMAWISEIEKQGYRRPGWRADQWTENWTADQFTQWGLEDVTLEPFHAKRWAEQQWSLEAWPKGRPSELVKIASWPIPMSKSVSNFQADLKLSPTLSAVTPGTIAVVEYPLMTFSQAQIRDEVATWSYDPDQEFDTMKHIVPMGERFQKVMDPEISKGAIGYLGILDFPWNASRYYVPYDGKPRHAPGLYLSRTEGDRLLHLMNKGPAVARINMQADMDETINHNVYASLPGRSDEWIVIGSHHDGPWHSAVEDASGIAMVMAQAHYWSRVPASERPHNMLFLLNGGHMSGGAGLHHFAKKHKDFLSNKVVAEIHLEHIAREARVKNGKLVPTGKPETRWWFTSYIPTLENIVSKAICDEDLTRSIIMPSTGWPQAHRKRPPTDASLFFPTTPVISLLSAPMYLFDPADRLNMVHEESIQPISRAVITMINELGKETVASLRDTEYEPARRPLPSNRCELLNTP